MFRRRRCRNFSNLFTPVYGRFTEGFNTSARLDSPKRSLTLIRCLKMITSSARLVSASFVGGFSAAFKVHYQLKSIMDVRSLVYVERLRGAKTEPSKSDG
jgi:hypothetical protein